MRMASCSASLQLPAAPQPGISRSSAAAMSRRLSHFNTCRQRKYRPHSTKLFAGPAYFPPTSYTDDYCRELHTDPHYKPEGSTRNNPHPTKEFMVYHLSKKETPQNITQSSILKLEGLIDITKQSTATTYQDDYLNSYYHENVQMKKGLSPSLKKEEDDDLHIPLLDSTMHHDYKVPVLNCNLKGNTTRYGCNSGIVKAAHGAVPTLDKQTLPPMSKYKTWYSSDFGRLSSGVRGSERQSKRKNHVTIHLPALVNNSQAATGSPKAEKRSRKVN